jgi:lipid-A-disaccharide synthase
MVSEVLIVAAEASSCSYAHRLLSEMLKINPKLKSFGVGSAAMESLGFERIGESERMAVVGLGEIIEHYKDIKKVFYDLLDLVKRRKPSIVILMDYPEFNIKFAEKIKGLGCRVVYYAAPQIWAWRTHRVKKIKKYFDEVICLFPFEEEFFREHQVPVHFFGHPILEEIQQQYLDSDQRALARSRCGISEKDFVLGIMPGSRKSELTQNFPTQLKAATMMAKTHSNLKLLVLVAPTVDREFVQSFLEDLKVPVMVQKEEPAKMISLCDLVLATSGTATLLVGLLQKPMVIMYKMKTFTYWVAKVLIRKIRFFGLPNLILNSEVAPECLQSKASPEHLCSVLSSFVSDPAKCSRTEKQLSELKHVLGETGASQRVALFLMKGVHESFVR